MFVLHIKAAKMSKMKCAVPMSFFMIHSSMSEWDHKCETRNAELEIGTDGSSQTWRDPRVDGYGSGFCSPRVSGSGFCPGLELNRPVFAVQIWTAGELPGPVANTGCRNKGWTNGSS